LSVCIDNESAYVKNNNSCVIRLSCCYSFVLLSCLDCEEHANVVYFNIKNVPRIPGIVKVIELLFCEHPA